MNKLTILLQTLADLHDTLLETAKKKQEILISGEVNPLLGVLSEESKLVKKIRDTDQVRTALLGEQSSLADIIAAEPDGVEKEEWTRLHQRLTQLLAEIQQVNETNQQLIKQSLTFTQFMMEQMLPKSEDSGVYSSKAGSKEPKESVRLFDAKA
ncbi:flagellar protein FlgN [Neobacillus niacini]|uniref:flagellar protein FlgN n=1 Tax=Neobacillus niacini TaxID=86668 RepID=UPI002041EAA6|nr:flagellar protein FlgN [Neobacillus niacini]MCM3693261.1 flagellar protein FlgN [Neobacillus niacini]